MFIFHLSVLLGCVAGFLCLLAEAEGCAKGGREGGHVDLATDRDGKSKGYAVVQFPNQQKPSMP